MFNPLVRAELFLIQLNRRKNVRAYHSTKRYERILFNLTVLSFLPKINRTSKRKHFRCHQYVRHRLQQSVMNLSGEHRKENWMKTKFHYLFRGNFCQNVLQISALSRLQLIDNRSCKHDIGISAALLNWANQSGSAFDSLISFKLLLL